MNTVGRACHTAAGRVSSRGARAATAQSYHHDHLLFQRPTVSGKPALKAPLLLYTEYNLIINVVIIINTFLPGSVDFWFAVSRPAGCTLMCTFGFGFFRAAAVGVVVPEEIKQGSELQQVY